MQNKKTLILIVLAVVALISLIRGMVTPSKIRRQLSSRPAVVSQDERVQLRERVVFSNRRTKRTEYPSWGRDPFALEISAEGLTSKLILEGIMWDEKNPQALINGRIVGADDNIGANTIVEIKKDRVILNDGTRNFELRL